MQVKQKLHINVAFLVVTMFVVALLVVLTLHRVNRVRQEAAIASEIAISEFERSALRSDYLRTNNERARLQWFAKHEQIGTLLNFARDTFNDVQDKRILERMLRDQEVTGKLFSELVENRRMSGAALDGDSDEIENRLITQLEIRLTDKILNARKLRDSADRHLSSALTLAGEIPAFFLEKRYVRKDSSIVWVRVSGSLRRDVEGRPVQIVGLIEDITDRKRLEDEIKHMAHHDALTGLPNRRLFMDIVNIEMAEARRNHKKLAILFLDLDRFKDINDTLGHDVGDQLLKEVAERLKAAIRASDTVARIGGDEFNIILSNILHGEDSADISRKILECFRQLFLIAGHELHATTSIGISIYPDDSEEIDALLRYADIAMYHAKELGKNNYQFYNPAINFRSVEKMRFESYLRQTLRRGELVVHYQPQIDIKTNRVICAEALVRWQHPERGLLAPEEFIPLAEETGFITAIDEWVLRTVCDHAASWLDAGLPSLCVTVNLSARQFQSPELVTTVGEILKETGLPADHLDLEITESMAMSNVERTAERLEKLTDMGVHITIDDFGTGYSSLNYLKRLPIDRLKIDRSFIKDIATDPDDRAIITAVTAMAHTMEIRVVAEGVETDDQLSFLQETLCDEAQGYLFSKPLPAGEFKELIGRRER